MKKVLITGVNGLIGSQVYAHLVAQKDAYDVYGLDRSHVLSERVAGAGGQQVDSAHFYKADLGDLEGVRLACEGMDVVVHLAANPNPNLSWQDLLDSNIVGTYNVFEACRMAGVKRVVYASSGQAVLGYRQIEPYKAVAEGRFEDVPAHFRKVDHTMPTRPMNPYGCAKVWGEALARTYADSHGLSCLCIRFGWVIANDALPYPNERDVWCSCRDAVQMVTRCMDARGDVRFDIFHAFSKSPYQWKDIEHARDVIGYVPQDDVERFA